jgi:streptothricin acetyltransferase
MLLARADSPLRTRGGVRGGVCLLGSTVLRPLEADDIDRLAEIRPTYSTDTILAVERLGSGLNLGWQLTERRVDPPFDKGTLYDFDEDRRDEIRERLNRADDFYQRVIEQDGRLAALLELEYQAWNNTVFVWNLMIDLDFRRQGFGRRLWFRALDYARDCEARAIMIETQNTNIAACRFYAEMGCKLVGLNEAFYTNDSSTSEVALFWTYLMPEKH